MEVCLLREWGCDGCGWEEVTIGGVMSDNCNLFNIIQACSSPTKLCGHEHRHAWTP